MKWSAAWGAACDPCAKAKTRCIRPQGDEAATTCNRCESLSISCNQQVKKPRKKRRRRNSSNLGDLATSQPLTKQDSTDRDVAHLPSGGHGLLLGPNRVTAAADRYPNAHAAGAESNVYVAQVKTEFNGAFNVSTWLPGFHPFPNPPCTCLEEEEEEGSADENNGLPGVTESDETLLAIYRTRLSPQFPFVIIPDHVSASELQRTRPFLAQAIKMVASLRSRRSMWRQSKFLLEHIAGSMFMRSDRSLDLLQGIIVYLGFYQYFCLAHGQLNNLAHLASSLLTDMRLDRPRARQPMRKRRPQGMDPAEPRAMLNDERRAILAVWYINSSSAAAFKKVNLPGRHFTEHMERLLQDLQEAPEYGTDEVLVQLICSQRITEMISQRQLSHQLVDLQSSSSAWAANLDKLLATQESILSRGSHLQTHRYLVSSHRNFAFLQLLEPQLVNLSPKTDDAVAVLQNTPDYFRTTLGNWKSKADIALRNWFEDWLAIPVCHLFYMPMSGSLQLMDATVILLRRARVKLIARYRLGDANTLEGDAHNGGNPHTASVDATDSSDDLMLNLLERLASRLEEARVEMAAAHCAEWANDLLDLVAWKLKERKSCIEKWDSIIANEAAYNNDAVRGGSGGGGGGGGETEEHDRYSKSAWDFGGGGMNNTNNAASAGGGGAMWQGMDETALWLDPFEEMLLSGQSFENWL